MVERTVKIDEETYKQVKALKKARRQTIKVILSEAVKLLLERITTDPVLSK